MTGAASITKALAIQGWMTPSELAFLQAIVFTLPERARMVEVGSWKGRSTVAICGALADLSDARLFVVDTFRGDPSILGDMSATGVETEFRSNTAPFSHMLEVVVDDSVAAAGQFADGFLDCVFIDANHEHEHVLADIRSWAPKLKPDGLFCGHDYGKFGLTLAVHQCFGRNVQHWESIWFTRSPCTRHLRFALEAAARRAIGRL